MDTNRLRAAIDEARSALYDVEDELAELERATGSVGTRPECGACGHPQRWHMPDRALCLSDGCRCTYRRDQAA